MQFAPYFGPYDQWPTLDNVLDGDPGEGGGELVPYFSKVKVVLLLGGE